MWKRNLFLWPLDSIHFIYMVESFTRYKGGICQLVLNWHVQKQKSTEKLTKSADNQFFSTLLTEAYQKFTETDRKGHEGLSKQTIKTQKHTEKIQKRTETNRNKLKRT